MRFVTFLPACLSAAAIVVLLSLSARADLAVETPAAAPEAAQKVAAPEVQEAPEEKTHGQSIAPQPAQTPVPELPMDDQMRRAKAGYEEATRNLTPEQLAELAALEAAFAATMETDMKILHRSAEMEHCLTHDGFFKADKNRHVKAFVEWRKAQKDAQEKLWNAHRIERAKARYISIVVLNEYYIYQSKLLRMIGMALARQQMQDGAFKNTDCDLLAKTLAAGE